MFSNAKRNPASRRASKTPDKVTTPKSPKRGRLTANPKQLKTVVLELEIENKALKDKNAELEAVLAASYDMIEDRERAIEELAEALKKSEAEVDYLRQHLQDSLPSFQEGPTRSNRWSNFRNRPIG